MENADDGVSNAPPPSFIALDRKGESIPLPTPGNGEGAVLGGESEPGSSVVYI